MESRAEHHFFQKMIHIIVFNLINVHNAVMFLFFFCVFVFFSTISSFHHNQTVQTTHTETQIECIKFFYSIFWKEMKINIYICIDRNQHTIMLPLLDVNITECSVNSMHFVLSFIDWNMNHIVCVCVRAPLDGVYANSIDL